MSEETNPILRHVIGASGCDGSILGFITSRQTAFKYSTGREPINFTPVYKNITSLAVANIDPGVAKVIKELHAQIEQLEYVSKKASEALAEAELCMTTLKNALDKIIPAVDEKLGIKREKK